jgi:hypothetical protein
MSYLDVAGYVAGGYDSGATTYASMAKYTFSTTAYAGIGASLQGTGTVFAGYFSATAGYVNGTAAGPTAINATKLTFSTEAASVIAVATGSYDHAAMQSKTIGYFYGAPSGDQKITFSTDTIAAWSAPANNPRYSWGTHGTSNNIKSHAFYNAGGGIFVFATETWSVAAFTGQTYGTIQGANGVSPNIQVII